MEAKNEFVSLEQIAKSSRPLLEAFLRHEKEETHQYLLEAAVELNLRHFALTGIPEETGHSSFEIVHKSGTLEMVRFSPESIEPLIVRGGITDLELGKTATNFACTWTDRACIDTIDSFGGVKCDSGSKADDTTPRDNVAAFPGGRPGVGLDDLIQLFERLPTLIIPEEGQRSDPPEKLIDWWEELKKRFGSNAIFDADYGEEVTTYSFLFRGGESDLLITVRLGEVAANFKKEGDIRELGTRYHFMPVEPTGTLILPRGE